MATLSELTAQVITARLAKRDMTLEELQKEMSAISTQLKAIEDGTLNETVSPEPIVAEDPKPQKINLKQYFKKDEVICLICNQGFKTLKRHLTKAHELTDKEYRKQFNIPSTQSLAAKSYSDSRRKMALDKGLGAGLVKYREAQAAKKVAVQVVEVAPAPIKKATKVKTPKVVVTVEKAAAPAKGNKKK